MPRSLRQVSSVRDKHGGAFPTRASIASSNNEPKDDEYRIRCQMLEKELKLCIAAGQRAEEAHLKEIEKLEEQTSHYATEQRALMNRFQHIDVVEDAIKDLHVQMKLRINQKEVTIASIDQEKDELKDESVLAVLGALHANLQHLWQFKVDAEKDLKSMRSQREQDLISKITELKQQTTVLAELLEKERNQHKSTMAQFQDAVSSRDELRQMSLAVTQEMEDKYKSLINELKSSEQEKKKLSEMLNLSQKEGRKRDSLVLKLQRLKEEKSNLVIRHGREINRMKHSHQKEISELKKTDLHLIEIEKDRQKLKTENQDLQRTVKSLKTNCTMKTIQEMEAKITRLQTQLKHSHLSSKNRSSTPIHQPKTKSLRPRPHSAVPQRVVRFEDEEDEKPLVWMHDDIDAVRNNVLETFDTIKATLKTNTFEQRQEQDN